MIAARSYLTVTLGEWMCSWPSHTPLTIHLSMSGRSPLLASSRFNASLSLSCTLTFAKSLLRRIPHDQRAVAVSCNQDGSCFISTQKGPVGGMYDKRAFSFPLGHNKNIVFLIFTCKDH